MIIKLKLLQNGKKSAKIGKILGSVCITPFIPLKNLLIKYAVKKIT